MKNQETYREATDVEILFYDSYPVFKMHEILIQKGVLSNPNGLVEQMGNWRTAVRYYLKFKESSEHIQWLGMNYFCSQLKSSTNAVL